MRLVNLTEFLKLPSGTMFCKYQPQIFDELCIKLDTINEMDFYYRNLYDINASGSEEETDMIYIAEEDSNYQLPIDCETYGRDGFFDRTQIYAVFTEEEKQKIKENI